MKWTSEQLDDLKAKCMSGVSNPALADYFGVPVTEIHAKRSQLGITIPKINALRTGSQDLPQKQSPCSDIPDIGGGLETFINAGAVCIVLCRQGDKALIVIPKRRICNFVVPLSHIQGESSWWQGHYFDCLDDAYRHYIGTDKEETEI